MKLFYFLILSVIILCSASSRRFKTKKNKKTKAIQVNDATVNSILTAVIDQVRVYNVGQGSGATVKSTATIGMANVNVNWIIDAGDSKSARYGNNPNDAANDNDVRNVGNLMATDLCGNNGFSNNRKGVIFV